MLSDITPYLTYFLIPVVPLITTTRPGITPLRIAFLGCLLISFMIQLRAVTSEVMWAWNYTPTNVDEDQARLWDWGDPPFLRGFAWWGTFVPPKLGSAPAAVHLYCPSGDHQELCKNSIDIFDRRWHAFRWDSKPPSGIRVVPARGQNQSEHSRLAIQLVKNNYSPGIYNLGELKITAVRTGKIKFTDVMPILIILHVGSPVQ